MAKKETTRTSIDELNESLSTFEQKVENNKKYIYWIAGGIVVLALIILGYVYGIHNPNMENAKAEIAKADMDLSLGKDSVALQEYLAVAANYSNDPANRASLNAAIILYKEGKYEEAAAYFQAKYNLQGDSSRLETVNARAVSFGNTSVSEGGFFRTGILILLPLILIFILNRIIYRNQHIRKEIQEMGIRFL